MPETMTIDYTIKRSSLMRQALRKGLAERRRRRADLDTSGLNHTAKRIIHVLQVEWRWSDGGNCWCGMDTLAQHIGRTRQKTRTALHELRDAGVVVHGPCYDHDYIPNGSGYFLTPKWDIY